MSLSDAALERLRAAAVAPETIGSRYLLVRELGRGGMGTVWLAEDSELDREVAVKVVRGVSDADAVERLAREARILARLEHPGIVPVHDVGRLPDGHLFYVMKRVRGDRLDQHFGPESPLPDRLRVFQRLCETVAFAHDRGVVHRDLKPENVMVGPFGEVLVLDWGVAKVLGAAEAAPAAGSSRDAARPGQTAEGTRLGTLEYMAPEQVEGRVDALGPRTDLYALGAILYFLAARRPPFGDRAPERLEEGGAGRLPEPLRRIDPSIPKALESIVAKAMSARSESRYASAGELERDIAQLLDGLPVTAHREGIFERVDRLLTRHKVAVALILVYLAVRALILVLGGT